MKIIVSDYKNLLEEDYDITYRHIKSILPEAIIKVIPFDDQEVFWSEMSDTKGLVTAFLPIDREFLKRCPLLTCISLSATGYGTVDLHAAGQAGVNVCHIGEYCTEEVAEHTLALILALNRNLKFYEKEIENNRKWRYQDVAGGQPLSEQTLAIFGYGKIGRAVAARAKAFHMNIMIVDPYVTKEKIAGDEVKLVDAATAFATCDIISNHMNLTSENYHYFNEEVFQRMLKTPLFVNVGRGACVDENALLRALEDGRLRGAGLDVLEDENPDLDSNPLLGRSNVILTPHSAFYSDRSIRKLQEISGRNLAYCLTGQFDKVEKLIDSNK